MTNEEQYNQISKDLDHFGNKASRWQMQLSVEKCKIIGLGICAKRNNHEKKHYWGEGAGVGINQKEGKRL